jgi:hypothetical protein
MQQLDQLTPPASNSIGLKMQETLLEWSKGEKQLPRYINFAFGMY